MAELGATVAVASTTDRIADRVRELEQRGLTASGHRADLTVVDQAESLVDEVLTRHGRLDILVNNAGMVSVTGDSESGVFADLSLETWHAGLARNLDTAFLATRAAVPHLPAGGRIVNVASVTGPVMAMRDEPVYAAAKAAMVGLTRRWRSTWVRNRSRPTPWPRMDRDRFADRERSPPGGGHSLGPQRLSGRGGGCGRLAQQPGCLLRHRPVCRRRRR